MADREKLINEYIKEYMPTDLAPEDGKRYMFHFLMSLGVNPNEPVTVAFEKLFSCRPFDSERSEKAVDDMLKKMGINSKVVLNWPQLFHSVGWYIICSDITCVRLQIGSPSNDSSYMATVKIFCKQYEQWLRAVTKRQFKVSSR